MPAKNDSSASLAETIERARGDYLKSISAKKRLPRQFLDGIVNGLGIAIGGTLVFGIIVYLLGHFFIVPQVQEWLEGIIRNVAS